MDFAYFELIVVARSSTEEDGGVLKNLRRLSLPSVAVLVSQFSLFLVHVRPN